MQMQVATRKAGLKLAGLLASAALHWAALSLAAGAALASGAMAQALEPLRAHPAGLAWPTKGWTKAAPSADTDAAQLEAALAALWDDKALTGQTRALVVVHRGRMVVERYRDGFGPDTLQTSWSMAKSITQALVGRAVMNGAIADIDAPMPLPKETPVGKLERSWRAWLTMTDGLAYREINATSMNTNDVALSMYGPGRLNVAAFGLGYSALYDQGKVWNYSSLGIHLVASALRPIMGGDPLAQKAWMDRELFTPLGMKAQPEFDAAGNFLGGSLVWASARDFAKFGYLYLRDGVWEGKRLLPEGWVDFARTRNSASNSNTYGAGWWITPPEGAGLGQASASALGPRDAFSAQGREGQVIWVVPSRDLVIVRLAMMPLGPERWAALYDACARLSMAFPAEPLPTGARRSAPG